MNKSIIVTLIVMFAIAALIINIFIISSCKVQLDDCRFEVNHLQTKIDRLEELGEYEMVLYQLLTPLGWAQLRAANEMIKNEQHKAYEGIEQPLIERRNKDEF